MQALDLAGWVVLADNVAGVLQAIAADGSNVALVQIGVTDEEITKQASETAITWARNRAAEMVGMQRIADRLMPNDDAEWRIDDTTRDKIREVVTQAEGEGWSNETLAKEIRDSYAFSGARAAMIARTETAMADVSGNMIAYRASGVVTGKQWITANDDLVSEECEENGNAGEIGLDDYFPSGDDAPPCHPNCRCDVIPIVAGDE